MIKEDNKWQALADRYFEGETTLEEEVALREFLAGNDDPRFDGLRAVMGFLVAERRSSEVRSRRLRWIPAVAAAVTVLIAAGVGMSRNTCVLYENGNRISDNTVVMEDVNNTLSELFGDSQRADVDDILGDLFN